MISGLPENKCGTNHYNATAYIPCDSPAFLTSNGAHKTAAAEDPLVLPGNGNRHGDNRDRPQ